MTGAAIFMGIVAIIIIYLLVSPFFIKNNRNIEEDDGFSDNAKEQIFMQLSELEYDFQMGKISEADYNRSKNELTYQASKFVVQAENRKVDIERAAESEIQRALEKQGIRKEISNET